MTRQLSLGLNYGHLSPHYVDVGTALGVTLESNFQRTPHDTFSVLVDFDSAAPWGKFGVHADYAFRSAEQFQIVASPWDQRAFGLLGTQIIFSDHHDRRSLRLFGTNLMNTAYRTAGRASLLSQIGVAYSTVGRPREVGLEVDQRF